MKVVLVSRCAWTLFNFRRNTALAAKERGLDVLCVGAPSAGYGDRLEALGLRFQAVPLSGRSVNPVGDVTTLLALRRIFARERPDVVHNFTIKPVIYGSIAARLAGVPVIVNSITGLGQVFSEHGAPLVRRVVELLYRISIPLGRHTFFQNAHDLAVFQRFRWFDGVSHTVVAGSGVDTRTFDSARFPERNGGGAVTFVMVARLLREKGVLEYCSAARQVRKRVPSARFLLVGGPDLASPSSIDSESLREVALGDVELCGAVDNVAEYLASADVAVLPSCYREGVPRALLEAGAMGKAIITTDWPGCRDTVVPGKTGLLVPPRDSMALAAAMESLIERPDRIREMGEAGRAFVRERFDEREIIETTLAAYGAGPPLAAER